LVDVLRKERKILLRLEEMRLTVGDVIEIAGKKKSYVPLWSSQPEDYGRALIRIDGYTRNNIGIRIDDKVTVRKVSVRNAECWPRATYAPDQHNGKKDRFCDHRHNAI
jgi:hypothetical protein